MTLQMTIITISSYMEKISTFPLSTSKPQVIITKSYLMKMILKNNMMKKLAVKMGDKTKKYVLLSQA